MNSPRILRGCLGVTARSMSNADLVRLEPGLRAHCLLAEYDFEDRGAAVLNSAHCGLDRAGKLGRVLDLLPVKAERLAELGVVGAVDRHAVPHVGLLRDTVGVMVPVAHLHRPVLAVVADDDQDRPAVSLDHRVLRNEPSPISAATGRLGAPRRACADRKKH
jgi:hypothetical protein